MEDYSSGDELDWFDGGFPEILGSSPALANDYSDGPSSLSPRSELAGDEDEDLDEDLDEELDEEEGDGEELENNHTASEGTYDSDSFLDEFTVHGYSDSRSSLSHSDSEGGAERSPSQPSSQSSSHNARFDSLLEELARNDGDGDDGDEEEDIDIANFSGLEPRIIYTFRRTQTHDGDVTETEAFERRTDPRWARRTVHHNRLGPPAFEAQHGGADISARARLPNLRRHDYRHHPYPSAAPRAPPPLPHHNHNHHNNHHHHQHNHQRNNHHNHHHYHHHRVHSQESQAPHSDELVDELVEMEVQRQASSSAGSRARAQQQAVTIDLTNDDDSDNQLTLPNDPRFRRPRNPVLQQQQQSYNAGPSQNRNNVRRPNGLGHRTPSLSRSDGSLLGGGGSGARGEYIDLTSDSEDVIMSRNPARATAVPRRVESNRHQPIAIPDEENERDFEREFEQELEREQERERERERMRIRERALPPPIPFADAFNIGRLFNRLMTGRDELEVQFLGQRQGLLPINQVVNPLAGNAPMLNYAANGFNNRPPTPRPEFEKPAAARAGFTRDTGEDLTLVCPGCEEELKYDPNSEDVNSTPARKPRTKKDREEHHFWAVKDCGHVYCKSCFESRLKKAGGKNSGGKNASVVNHTFQLDGKKTVCAVPDCTSDVTAKAAWVGIFL